jgi:hypothetical protein
VTDPALGRDEDLSEDDAADIESIREMAGDRPLDAQTPYFPADTVLE